MKPPINLYLATSVGCNVRCKSCPAGRKEFEPGGSMTLEMMERIVDKCLAEARVLGVQLYHYNEPTLHPQMADMVAACHRRGLPVFLSTNLVVWKNVPAILAQAPEMFLVSVSGFTQSVYERSHKNGDIERVKQHMAQCAQLRRPGTTLQLSWHRYAYNEHELPLMRAYAESLGFNFVPYGTSLIPHDRALRQWETGVPDPNGADVLVPVADARQLCYDRRGWDCILQDQIIAVNGQGQVLLCSNLMDAANLRGNLFETTVPELLRARRTDAFCTSCKAVGGHIYAMQYYTRGRWSPLVWAEMLYRRMKLQGRWPKLTAWATKSLYRISRPQKEGGF